MEEEPEDNGLWSRLRRWIAAEIRWFDRFLKAWFVRLIVIGAHTALLIAACYAAVWWMAHDGIYDRLEDVPPRSVGLVLGAIPKIGRYDNLFFVERIKAAAELYKADRVKFLIVSGDNHIQGYDEPTAMKDALIERGVPAERIYCDYAGFHTLDSVLRARQVFGQTEVTIISQRFHNERALYIAKRKGMPEAVAYNARDPHAESMINMYLREIASRVLAVLHVEFMGTQPKFLGPSINIGVETPPVDANK